MATSGFVNNWQSGKSLSDSNLHMLTSEISCDVSFRVGEAETMVRAHRYILISRSCVFSAMLCGPLAEKDEIAIKDVNTDEFQEFMRYLYTDNIVLTPDNVTTMLYLAKKYAVGSLESMSVSYLENCLSEDTACIILEQAHSFDEKLLYSQALKVIRNNVRNVLCSPGFKDLCPECFRAVITSTEMRTHPEHVFEAALKWSVAECWRKDLKATPENKRKILDSNLHHIYFPDMGKEFFVKTVVGSKVLTNEEHVKILSYFVCPDVDISPFKTNFPKKRQIKRESAPVEKFDVSLFERQVRLSKTPAENQIFDDFCVTCSDHVLLHGMHVHGAGRQHILPHKYHVRVFNRSNSGFSKLIYEFELTPDTTSDNYGVSTARLVAPLPMEKDTMYNFQIRKIVGDLPLFAGLYIRSKVTVGNYTFSLQSGLSPVKYVSGFLFSASSTNVIKMTAEPVSVHL